MSKEQSITYVDKATKSTIFNDNFLRACNPLQSGEYLLVLARVDTVENIACRHGQTGIKLTGGIARTF